MRKCDLVLTPFVSSNFIYLHLTFGSHVSFQPGWPRPLSLLSQAAFFLSCAPAACLGRLSVIPWPISWPCLAPLSPWCLWSPPLPLSMGYPQSSTDTDIPIHRYQFLETDPNRYRYRFLEKLHTDTDTINHTDTQDLICYRFLQIIYRYYLKEWANFMDSDSVMCEIPYTDSDMHLSLLF